MLDDETLRDGLQSPSVRTPAIDQKLDLLERMDALGIDTADIGLPGAGRARGRGRRAAGARDRPIGGCRSRANCAARTVVADIRPIAEVVQRTGVADRVLRVHRLEPDPPVRRGLDARLPAEDHRGRHRVRGQAKACTVMYVTEDTTRADPASLRALFTTALGAGASRLCIADTVGHATPAGARAVVAFVQSLVAELGVGRRHRLARPPRPRVRRRQRARGARRRARRGCTAPRSASASAAATRRSICCSSTW